MLTRSPENVDRSSKTLEIERLLQTGEHSISEIGRLQGVTRQRVQFIQRRLFGEWVQVAPQPPEPSCTPSSHVESNSMKALTIRFTPAVFAALSLACETVNSRDPEEPLTLEDFVSECAINRIIEMGLLRKKVK